MHGRIYIVLKESLKKLPLLGWGMSMSKFIFLKRNWEEDKSGLAEHLRSLNKPEDPMWLMFFPEGTNLASDTREKSRKWAEKNGWKDFQHVLLPRSTGLHFCLLKLRETVDYVYDCTFAYEGVKRGEYAQDIYTIESSFLSGRPPKSVNMYWRRFQISKIPLDDINAFDIWLRARWAEKDALMEHYMRTGRFPADEGVDETPEGEIRRGAGYIETQVKPHNWYEILQVFAPIATFVIVLFYFYNITIPPSFFSTIQDWAGMGEDEIKQKLRVGAPPKLGKPKAITSKTVAQTLKPPSIQGDQKAPVQAFARAKPVQRTPKKVTASKSKPALAPHATVQKLPDNKPALKNSLNLANPPTKPVHTNSPATPVKSVPAKSPATKTTAPSPNPPVQAHPVKTPSQEAKSAQTEPTKAPISRKPEAKPTSIKKPLKKTVYPPKTAKNETRPQKPLKKIVYPIKPSVDETTAKRPPMQKTTLAPAPKPAIKAQPPKKPTLLPKTEPRRASIQTTTEGWSDTTAVETPWAERPSGKRAVKAQATRKDRVRMEKKQQRLHLEKTGA